MTFHNSAHCGKSWAQLSFSPLARALRNVEKEGLESPSCMNASIWKEWKCIKCKFLCGIESRLPGCAESIFFPGARWHLSGCLGKHCWRLLHNTNDSMKNQQLHNFHNGHCHHHCHFGRDGGQDKMSIDLLRWRLAQIFQPAEMKKIVGLLKCLTREQKQNFVAFRNVWPWERPSKPSPPLHSSRLHIGWTGLHVMYL